MPQLERSAVLPRLLPLTAMVFLGVLSISAALPVLPLRVHDALGFGPVMVGLTVGLQSLTTVATRGFSGSLVDRRGAKWSVVAGLPLATLSGLAYLASLAVSSPVARLLVLLAGRLVLGLAESLIITGALTWGIGRVGPAHTGQVMSWNGIAVYAALAVGAPLGVWVDARYGFGGVALLAVACPLASLIIALVLPAVPPVPGGKRVSFVKVIGLVWRPGVVVALSTAPFALLGSFVVLAFADRGWGGAGLALSLFGGTFILVRLLFSGLPGRYGGARVTLYCLIVEAVGQAMLWLAPGPEVALLGAALSGTGFSLIFPAMGAEAVHQVPPESRGLAVGGFVAFFDIALGLSGPVAGLLVAHAGFASAFLLGTVVCVLALIALPRHRTPHPHAEG